MTTALFTSLMEDLCRANAIAVPKADGNGIIRLAYQGNTLHFEHFPDNEMFFLYAKVGSLMQNGSNALLKKLLQANCLYKDTGGCTLGLDDKDRVILSVYAKLTEMQSDIFQNIVNNFAFEVTKWAQSITSFHAEPSQAEEAGALRV